MTENTKVSCYWLIGIYFVFITLMLSLGYLKYKKGEHLYKNREYAIGTLVKNDGPRTGLRTGSSPMFFFDFNTEHKEMKNIESIGYQIVSWEEGIVGDQYLEVYDKTDPENAIILLDHPTNDTTMFDKYMEEFKTEPLNITRYFRMRALFFLKDY